MKKIITLFFILISAANISGQNTADIILKAKAYLERGQHSTAISCLSEAISKSEDFALFMQRADAKVAKGDYSGAISDYNEANRLNSFSGEYGLSQIYALKGDVVTALYHLELNINSAFRKCEKNILLDPAFGAVENRPEWRQFWKTERYTTLEKGISDIEYFSAAGKIDDAKNLLTELRISNSEATETDYAEALINLSSRNYAEVLKNLTGLLISEPENEKYLRLQAKAQSGSSNFAGASVTYGQLLSLGIADAGLFLLRAECYRKTGETSRALSDIERYLELYPDSKSALSLAGKVEVAAGDNLKALQYFSRNLELHPNDSECYVDRANSYFMAKSWDWAISDYSMSLDLNPGNSEVWLSKGMAQLNSGHQEDACHDFRKAMSLGNKKASGYISNNCIK